MSSKKALVNSLSTIKMFRPFLCSGRPCQLTRFLCAYLQVDYLRHGYLGRGLGFFDRFFYYGLRRFGLDGRLNFLYRLDFL